MNKKNEAYTDHMIMDPNAAYEITQQTVDLPGQCQTEC